MKKFPPIVIIGALFFIFGFVTWLNATLIPYLKLACELSHLQSMFVAFAFYIAYFLFALPSGALLKKTGLKKGMAWGLVVMALGALLFIPGSWYRSYPLFLLGLFVLGSGLTILQTAANPYVAIIGPPESAAKRISIMGVCNKLAGGIAPFILGSIVLKNADTIHNILPSLDDISKNRLLDELSQRATLPYLAIAAILLLLALVVFFSHLPEIHEDDATPEQASSDSIWKHKNLVWGVFTLFFYIGIEVIAIDTLIQYRASWGFDLGGGSYLPMLAMLALIAGYFIGIATIPKYLSQQKALLYSGLLGLVLVSCALLTEGMTSVYCIVALGLANALVWPSVWGLALIDLGRHTRLGSALLIMSIAGGALLPLLYGYLTDLYSAHAAYSIGLLCYFVICMYAWSQRPAKKLLR